MSVTSNLPLKLGLVDTKNQLTAHIPDRASDAYVVNPDGVMIHYRGNGENLIEDSDDLTAGSWTSPDSVVNTATTFTIIAQYGGMYNSITTTDGKTYILSFKARAISGNTNLQFYHLDSATAGSQPLTVTSTLTRYSVAVLGKAGGGNVNFGIADYNAANHGQIEFTDIQVEETSVPINEREDESDYIDHRISLADGASWFGGDDLGSDLFDAGAGTFDGAGTYAWTVYGTNGLANDGNTLKITYVDNGNGAHLEFRDTEDLTSDLTVGQLYKLQLDAKVGAGDSVQLRVWDGDSTAVIATVTLTEFQTYVYYFIAANATTAYLQMNDMGGGEDIWLDNITIQAVTSPAEFADSGFLLQVTDGSGNKASGYIGEAGTGETLDTELLDNWSFDADVTGWSLWKTATVDSVAGGISNNAARITEDNTGDNPLLYRDQTTVANKAYRFSAWVKQGTESTYAIKFDISTYTSIVISGESTATWTHKELTAVAFDISEVVRLQQTTVQASGTTIFFDEASFKEVTEPNPNSVMIYKTNVLSSEGWANIEDGFDPNDIATWEIYDNKLGDTEPRVYTATSGGTAVIPAEAAFDSKGLVNIGPVTNWLLQSNGFDQAAWAGGVLTTQDETDIAGNANTAWTIEDDDAGTVDIFYQAIAKATSDTNIYTVSFYLKKDSTTSRFPEFELDFLGVASKVYAVQMNTSTGAVNERLTAAGNRSYEILDKGDWWKVSLSASDNGNNPIIRVYIIPAMGQTLGAVDNAAVGSIIICHAMLTKTPYALPFHIPTLSVPVTTTSQVVPWTMSTVIKGVYDDTVNGTESEFTTIFIWTPYYDEADGSGTTGILSLVGSATSLLYTTHGSTLIVTDGTNTASVTLSWVNGVSYTVAIRGSKRQDSLQLSVIDAGALTNGTATNYDGKMTLGTDFIIGYANNLPSSNSNIITLNSVLSDGELLQYPDFGYVRRHIKQGR